VTGLVGVLVGIAVVRAAAAVEVLKVKKGEDVVREST